MPRPPHSSWFDHPNIWWCQRCYPRNSTWCCVGHMWLVPETIRCSGRMWRHAEAAELNPEKCECYCSSDCVRRCSRCVLQVSYMILSQ
jgi:hypothetical protein